MEASPLDTMVTYDPPWWISWRATKWNKLKSRIEPREPSPEEPLSEVIASDISVLDRVLSNVNGFKRELAQLHLCEGKAEDFDASSDEYTSGADTPRQGSPSPSPPFMQDEESGVTSPPTKGESGDGTPTQPTPMTAAELAQMERRRRRDMVRKVKVAADNLKAEHRRRIEQIHLHQQRRQRLDASSAGAIPGPSHQPTPVSSAAQSPMYELNVEFGSDSSIEDGLYKQAWVEYTRVWKTIEKPSRPSTPLTFANFPWPVLNRPATVKDLDKSSIMAFFHHAPQSSPEYSHKENKSSVHQAVRRWHPDRSAWLIRVAPEDKENIRKGADIVIRVLNQLGAVDK